MSSKLFSAKLGIPAIMSNLKSNSCSIENYDEKSCGRKWGHDYRTGKKMDEFITIVYSTEGEGSLVS